MTSKAVCKVIVSGGILKSSTIIREYNTEKKSSRYIEGKNKRNYWKEQSV